MLEPVNGGDGAFQSVGMSGRTVLQAASGFIYFKRPAGVQFQAGATLYAEVDYLDLGGPGHFGLQYNAQGDDFHDCKYLFNNSVGKSGAFKTAVFKLAGADLRGAESMGADMRLTHSDGLRLNIVAARIDSKPGAAFLRATAFIAPYAGAGYAGLDKVDASSVVGKVVCGYQGWFRTPGDDTDTGWEHYIPDWGGELMPSKIAMDMWPDMTEFTPAEQHLAPGFSYPDGRQATLFSSHNWRTVLRHFQWMQAWGIDGVALQRNADDLQDANPEYIRDLSYVRAAANMTGRCYYIEYALKIPTKAADLPYIERDWHMLNDVMHITQDPAYLHEGGKPVVGIFGFYSSQIESPETANEVLDIFSEPGPYQAFVAGAGLWSWRTAFSNSWKQVIYRLGSYQPWNTGNAQGGAIGPNTSYWAADKADLAAHHVLYQPQIYPGGSDDNRSHRAGHSNSNPRAKGSFYWSQFAAATGIGAPWAFVGMFDELDEGTEIFKVTSSPPTQAYFIGYEGLPSDCYLCFTSKGAQMLRHQIPFSQSKPDCAALTQPSIPEALAPGWNASLSGTQVSFTWSQAFPAQSSTSAVDHYDVEIDGRALPSKGLGMALNLAAGRHAWRVRAVNSLGNASGWSMRLPFTLQ